jgi:DtxR family transcriptional regulator, Mn-dependent transcriptional regulator
MPSRTIENYLKQLYLEEQQATSDKPVAMGRLASIMNVVPGTATTMVKALSDSGLVKYSPRTGVKLTAAGNQLALHVLRRHRLVELFLVQVVGLDWSEVHEEAEEMEHVISEKVLAKIDALLGHPTADPHGDPIPSSTGQVPRSGTESLATCAVGKGVEIVRILDQEPKFLQFVREQGLSPGERVKVKERNEGADAVVIEKRGGGAKLTLSTTAAGKFLVKGA